VGGGGGGGGGSKKEEELADEDDKSPMVEVVWEEVGVEDVETDGDDDVDHVVNVGGA
jgi:hypothetical protein